MADIDTVLPVLRGIRLQSSVDVRQGGATGVFSVDAFDAGSGIYQVYVLFDRSFNSGPTRTNILAFYNSTDSFDDGRSILRQGFTADTPAGTYNVTSVQVYDNAGNYRIYSAAEVAALGGQTSFRIESEVAEDRVQPRLTGLILQPTVDVTEGTATGLFAAGAADEGSGIYQVYVLFDRSFNSGPTRTNILAFYNSTDSFDDGRSILRQGFTADTPAGTYNVTSVQVYDNAGNYRIYSAAEVAALGGQTSFRIESEVAEDRVQPRLTGLILQPTVDVTEGTATGLFAAGAADEGSGIYQVYVLFDRSFNSGPTRTNILAFYNSTDSFDDGRSILRQGFTADTPAGTYNVTSVQVYDNAGNYRIYSAAEVAALGGQTRFQIVDRNATVTADLTVWGSVTEGANSSLPAQLVLRNVSSWSGQVSVTFDAANSTVTRGEDFDFFDFNGSYSVSLTPAGDYVIDLPSIGIVDDTLVEGNEVLAFTVRASGLVFESGTDSTTVYVTLRDNDAPTRGDDIIIGGPGVDRLVGLGGNDRMYGRGGDDILMGGAGNDLIDGGDGFDFASYTDATASVTVALVRVGVEQATGGAGVDTLIGIEGLLGSDFADLLIGDAGNNILAGRGGADTLRGGIGDDVYYVEDAGDVVIENSNQGIDTVRTGLGTYWLPTNVENLTGLSGGGQDLGGNALNNVITGGSGNDRIVGGAGIDTMIGGLGNDVYSVDRSDDMVVELAGQGTDSVFSSVSYSIAVQHVENIALTGTANIDATGNSLYNVLIGNSGNNIIDGRGGRDVITGGAGRDQFNFTTPLGAGNIDTITDFSVADDTIGLSRWIFAGAGPAGMLGAGAFHVGAAAADAGDRIIYNSATGALLYDADGTGAGAAVQFARVAAGLAMTNADFLLI